MAAWHVALVGATGIVGEEILRVLEADFPLDYR
jgi:aspartate-semialdehyde dehydrogenase